LSNSQPLNSNLMQRSTEASQPSAIFKLLISRIGKMLGII